MTRERHRGGRGRRSENKYERFTVSLSPDLLQKLDELAQVREVSRSGMMAEMVEAYRSESVHTGLGEATPGVPVTNPPDLLPTVENALLAFDHVGTCETFQKADWSDSEWNAFQDVGETLRTLQRRLTGVPDPDFTYDPDDWPYTTPGED